MECDCHPSEQELKRRREFEEELKIEHQVEDYIEYLNNEDELRDYDEEAEVANFRASLEER